MAADGRDSAGVPLYRQFIIGNYRLIYREDEANQVVFIIGVIHAGRELLPILESRNP